MRSGWRSASWLTIAGSWMAETQITSQSLFLRKPRPDLVELIESQNISFVYPEDDEFTNSAGSALLERLN